MSLKHRRDASRNSNGRVHSCHHSATSWHLLQHLHLTVYPDEKKCNIIFKLIHLIILKHRFSSIIFNAPETNCILQSNECEGKRSGKMQQHVSCNCSSILFSTTLSWLHLPKGSLSYPSAMLLSEPCFDSTFDSRNRNDIRHSIMCVTEMYNFTSKYSGVVYK